VAEEPTTFRIVGSIQNVETIAVGRGVRLRHVLKEIYGGQNWRKLKGIAWVEAVSGYAGYAEIHWYEAHGVGPVWWKIKQPLK
jgi:hypothetical protein